MGSGWWIKTFDKLAWDGLFGGGAPEARDVVLHTLLWEEDGYFDGSDDLRAGPGRDAILQTEKGRSALALAHHLTAHGFTYDGLDAKMARLLDSFGWSVWHPEGWDTGLAVMTHSPDFVSLLFTNELLDRIDVRASETWIERIFGAKAGVSAPQKRIAAWLKDGRRFGRDEPVGWSQGNCYVIFSPDEARQLRSEWTEAAARPPTPGFKSRFPQTTDQEISQYLLHPLAEAVGTGRWVAMTWN